MKLPVAVRAQDVALENFRLHSRYCESVDAGCDFKSLLRRISMMEIQTRAVRLATPYALFTRPELLQTIMPPPRRMSRLQGQLIGVSFIEPLLRLLLSLRETGFSSMSLSGVPFTDPAYSNAGTRQHITGVFYCPEMPITAIGRIFVWHKDPLQGTPHATHENETVITDPVRPRVSAQLLRRSEHRQQG